MRDRVAFGYVVSVEGTRITLNIKDAHRGYVVSHREGIAEVEPNGFFGVDAGSRLLVLRTKSVMFSEPADAHRSGVGSTDVTRVPLRQMAATVYGTVERVKGEPAFSGDRLASPALGAEAFPLLPDELGALLSNAHGDEAALLIGQAIGGGGPLAVDARQVLPRHMAVLGSTGQGKSCFVAAMLQQVVKWPKPRVVVFDINGEYKPAVEPMLRAGEYRETILGGSAPTRKLPYVALGRQGLNRLLIPSERTQRPALNFALDHLRYVTCTGATQGAALSNQATPVLFDDCRAGDATAALAAIESLRKGVVPAATVWPHMGALGCLIADSYALKQGSKLPERGAFEYGNVAPLVTRIRRLLEDPQFTAVVDVGEQSGTGVALSWEAESTALVEDMFGGADSTWKIHRVDLSRVAHDLLPLLLGSLLELFAFELFRRGPGGTYPTLLVLEEAHHYLRGVTEETNGEPNALAYERLAKEGRKFGVSICLSTQRPSEVSPTVLGQCGTWVVFRLTGEKDLRAVASASEWSDREDLDRIAGLLRQHALVFGGTVNLPTIVRTATANPLPLSKDADFGQWQHSPAEAF